MTGGAARSIEVEEWGNVDGQTVKLYTLTSRNGIVLKVTNYGAIVTQLHLPDRNGNFADVVLGYDDVAGYQRGKSYFGAIVGRCANRINQGRFTLDDTNYQLARNDGPHHLHGGTKGFNAYVWHDEIIADSSDPGVRLRHVSPAGDENYPGQLTATVEYVLNGQDELLANMTATTDAPTVVNLVQHTYWNLAGHSAGEVLRHEAMISAQQYTPVDGTLIPTGKFASVAGTPFDFIQPKPIGRDLKAVGGKPIGFDHNFVLTGEPTAMKLAAQVLEPASGRQIEVSCNQPGMQFYTGNFLDGSEIGKGGAAYQQYVGFCLETQSFPDSINKPHWPSVVLRPGQEYRHIMHFKFSVR